MKYLGITLRKYIEDQNEKNYKTLMNKIQEKLKLNKWR